MALVGAADYCEMIVFRANITNHFDQAGLFAFGAKRANKYGSIGVKASVAFEAKIPICVGVAGFGAGILAATGEQGQKRHGDA